MAQNARQRTAAVLGGLAMVLGMITLVVWLVSGSTESNTAFAAISSVAVGGLVVYLSRTTTTQN